MKKAQKPRPWPKGKGPAKIQWASRKGRFVFRARVMVHGRQVPDQPWRTTRAEAEADRDAIEKRRMDGPIKIVTLADAMKMALAKCEKKGRRPATVTAYRERFHILSEAFPNNPSLDSLTAPKIEAWCRLCLEGKWMFRDRTGELRTRKVSVATIRGNLRALRRCYSVAGKASPIREVVENLPDPPDPEIDWFDRPELGKILGKIRKTRRSKATDKFDASRDADVIEFLASTGVRLREATDITVGDVNLSAKVMRIIEGKRGSRTVPLASPELLKIVKRFLSGRQGFRARRGDRLLPLGYEGTKMMLRRWAERLDEPRLHAHALRHSFGTQLAKNGTTERKIMAAMGHRTLGMAIHYTHITGADVAEEVGSVSWTA